MYFEEELEAARDGAAGGVTRGAMPAGTGDVFLLSGCTHGSFQQLPALERQKV